MQRKRERGGGKEKEKGKITKSGIQDNKREALAEGHESKWKGGSNR